MVRELLALAVLVMEAITLSPRTQAQVEALQSIEPECLYSGRKFAGKSWVVVVKGFGYSQHYPGARVLWSREERRAMENTTLEVARHVLPPHVWSHWWREGKSRFEFPNGSQIDVLGLDEPDRIQGSRYGFIGVDQAEQISFRQCELANSCVGQLGMPWHQLLLAANPDTPAHHLYRTYRPDEGSGLRMRDGQVFARVIRVGRDDLLDIMPASYRARLERLSGVRRRQLVDGEWCANEGLVYGAVWDPATMAGVARPESWLRWAGYPPPDWDRIRGIDFGFDHAAVCLWFAAEPGRDKLWLYRQHYRSGLSPRRNALAIAELEERELNALRASCDDERAAREMSPYLAKLNVVESWADHDRGERETYDEQGVWSEPADKDVVAGIGAVADFMHEGNLVTVEGNLAERDERLAGLEEPTCLEEEIPLYHRAGGDEDGVGRKEAPVKERDHALDALRYVVNSRATAHKPGVYA